jgi:DNA-binding NarL/FixJ family response regulator
MGIMGTLFGKSTCYSWSLLYNGISTLSRFGMNESETNNGLQIIIVHPTEIVRLGLCALFEKCEYLVYRSFEACDSLFSQLKWFPNALILVHHSLCQHQGSIRKVIEHTGATIALIASSDLAHNDSFQDLSEKIEEGVTGFIDLNEPLHIFLSKIEDIASGSFVISKSFVSQLTEKNVPNYKDINEILNDRELEILDLVANGSTNKEIGQKLYISEHTVKSYISQILTKLDLKNRQQAAVYLIKNRMDV